LKSASQQQVALDPSTVKEIIAYALREDLGSGDITTNAIFGESSRSKGAIVAKEEGIVAGLPIAKEVFAQLSTDVEWKEFKRDGERTKKGEVLVELSGPTRTILSGERVALNFIQRMSGIATITERFVSAVSGFKAQILDTRKTAPGLRPLDKYAVRAGGGRNHRIGLFDGILIKDNHIRLAGGIVEAVQLLRKNLDPARLRDLKIEVEAGNLTEVREAIEAGADIILLDNMSLNDIRRSVALIGGRALVEVSGGVTLDNVRNIAEAGADFISVGLLTHSPKALDVSLEILW
jgi:nicotinate-nucleotide pyrophosphorylase (carboxylating)